MLLSHSVRITPLCFDPREAQPYPLFSEGFLQLADFLLDLPTYLFDQALCF